MTNDDPRLRYQPLQKAADGKDRFHTVVDEVHLPAPRHFVSNSALDHRGIERHHVGLNRKTILGRCLDDRHVPMPTSDMFSVRGIGVAVIVKTSTRFRICLMRSLCATPKSLFLVDHQQPEVPEHDVLREQAMRADDDVDLAGGQTLDARPSSLACCESG